MICQAINSHNVHCRIESAFFRNDKYWCKFHRPLETCSICYEVVEKGVNKITACNHEFHRKCLEKWLETNNTCPLCRFKLYESDSESESGSDSGSDSESEAEAEYEEYRLQRSYSI